MSPSAQCLQRMPPESSRLLAALAVHRLAARIPARLRLAPVTFMRDARAQPQTSPRERAGESGTRTPGGAGRSSAERARRGLSARRCRWCCSCLPRPTTSSSEALETVDAAEARCALGGGASWRPSIPAGTRAARWPPKRPPECLRVSANIGPASKHSRHEATTAAVQRLPRLPLNTTRSHATH